MVAREFFCFNSITVFCAVLWSQSRLEPDFFAGAGVGEKAQRSGCCCVAYGHCGSKVATILIKFCHILTIYSKNERKNRYRYTLKKAKLFSFQNCIFYLYLGHNIFVIRIRSWEPELVAETGA